MEQKQSTANATVSPEIPDENDGSVQTTTAEKAFKRERTFQPAYCRPTPDRGKARNVMPIKGAKMKARGARRS